jgi:hypothetical protein
LEHECECGDDDGDDGVGSKCVYLSGARGLEDEPRAVALELECVDVDGVAYRCGCQTEILWLSGGCFGTVEGREDDLDVCQYTNFVDMLGSYVPLSFDARVLCRMLRT